MKSKQKEQYDQTAKFLPPLNSDEVVRVREQHWDRRAAVLEEGKPGLYRVRTEDGEEYIRNRRHHLQVKEPYMPDYKHQEEKTGVRRSREEMEDQPATRTSNVAPPAGDPGNIDVH